MTGRPHRGYGSTTPRDHIGHL
ncbi:MAG: hypothetical protein JWQ07_5239, partial [Ramlibacter sp.]|nr:hypothetical protein [Ramlibacter sp.]